MTASTSTSATDVVLDNTEVANNTAYTRGGGICSDTASTGAGVSLTLRNKTNLHNNSATATRSKGGGVYFGAGTITLDKVQFADNDADTGDGLYRVTGTTVAPNPDVTYVNDSAAVGS